MWVCVWTYSSILLFQYNFDNIRSSCSRITIRQTKTLINRMQASNQNSRWRVRFISLAPIIIFLQCVLGCTRSWRYGSTHNYTTVTSIHARAREHSIWCVLQYKEIVLRNILLLLWLSELVQTFSFQVSWRVGRFWISVYAAKTSKAQHPASATWYIWLKELTKLTIIFVSSRFNCV